MIAEGFDAITKIDDYLNGIGGTKGLNEAVSSDS